MKKMPFTNGITSQWICDFKSFISLSNALFGYEFGHFFTGIIHIQKFFNTLTMLTTGEFSIVANKFIASEEMIQFIQQLKIFS